VPTEVRVADQVARHLLISRTLRNGTRSTVLNLHPENLGSVRVTVEVQSGQVRLGFTAGQAALSALRADLPQLRTQLGQEGLTLTDVQTQAQDSDTPRNGSSRSDTTGGTGPDGDGAGSGTGADRGPRAPSGSAPGPRADPDPGTDGAETRSGLDIRV
jgi:flagellar hook-length control protein FliK